MRRDDIIDELPLATVERLAHIIGESSAAARALKDADAHGGRENAIFCRSARGTLVVFHNALVSAEKQV